MAERPVGHGAATVSEESKAKEALDLFQVQYEYSRRFFDEMNKVGQTYDQIIDPATWETSSEITLGQAFAIVQNALPAVMYYTLWAPDVPFELIPRDPNLSYDVSRKVRDNIIYTQRERMNLETEGFLTVQSAMKFGIGYLIVEPKPITPGGFGVGIAAAGSVSEKITKLGVGKTIDITSARHIPVGRVYPTPDGASPNKVAATTWLDYISDVELLRISRIKDNFLNINEAKANEIINYARKTKLNGNTSSARNVADYLSRRKTSVAESMNIRGQTNMPVMVPVLKQYRENRHIWIMAERFVTLDIQDQFQTLQCPITKATYAPDGNQWFTKGMVARAYDPIVAIETWVNSIIDILDLSTRPHKIVNIDQTADEDIQEDVAPFGVTRVHGDVRTAQTFAQMPQLPAQGMAIPDQLKGFVNDIVGSAPTAQQKSTPGIVRGGSGALESLLQVSSGREKMSAKHMENGWYKDVCILTLIYNQMLNTDEDVYTVLATAGEDDEEETGKRYFKAASVTSDEIRQEWRFEFNFREKLKNFVAEMGARVQVYDRLIKNQNADPKELMQYLIGDEYVAERLKGSVDPAQRLQEIAATEGGASPAQNPETAGRGQGIPA